MSIDALITPPLIKTKQFPVDEAFKIRIARAYDDPKLRKALDAGHLEVQTGGYTSHMCTLTLIGSNSKPRSVANLTLDLKEVEEVIRYNPADLHLDEWGAKEHRKYSEKTQADFAGAKKRNLVDYTMYGLEALRGERKANLPEINGWCDVITSEETLFVALHAPTSYMYYGRLFFPSKYPIMQSDGQTQTAMLFQLAKTKYGVTRKQAFRVKLELEFGVKPDDAGQAFSDRNGRGVKKNRNLVTDLAVSGGLKKILEGAIKDTIFAERTYRGRGRDAISETSTNMILDLATLEQVAVNITTHGTRKPEHFKECHVNTYTPFVHSFLQMLDHTFGSYWPKDSSGGDPYRRLYVHGWSFCFKALAKAYGRSRFHELAPLAEAMLPMDLDTMESDTEEAWLERAAKLTKEDAARPPDERKYVSLLTPTELANRLAKIDWVRHRKHWVEITGFTRNAKTGAPMKRKLADGEEVIKAKAPTQQEVISGIEGKILGPEWQDLTVKVDFPVEE